MRQFRVHMINSDFESRDDIDYSSLEAAFKAGIAAASRVATEAISEGHESSSVEIRVEEDGEVVGRRVLTFSVSDLMIGQ